ncbi:hypothetical protein M0802_009159 [Mischocyttarus mexicanus]|nr:hypothetical protein M0802_009159 [Mischocyttarus mexicanus]
MTISKSNGLKGKPVSQDASIGIPQEEAALRLQRLLRDLLTQDWCYVADVNQSGAIDKKDFDLAVQRICNSRHWSADNPKSTQTKDTLLKIWESLQQRADSDQDGQIKIKNKKKQETESDGSIDENEFSNVCHSHGVQEAEARDAFKKMGVGNEVTRDKFYELWKQYFTSDDPNAPGNFIFGKTSF